MILFFPTLNYGIKAVITHKYTANKDHLKLLLLKISIIG